MWDFVSDEVFGGYFWSSMALLLLLCVVIPYPPYSVVVWLCAILLCVVFRRILIVPVQKTDILEVLARSKKPLSQQEIVEALNTRLTVRELQFVSHHLVCQQIADLLANGEITCTSSNNNFSGEVERFSFKP